MRQSTWRKDLSPERWRIHSHNTSPSSFKRNILGGDFSVKSETLAVYSECDLNTRKWSLSASCSGILGQLVCCWRVICGVNPWPRCPLTCGPTATSTRQGERLSQRKRPGRADGEAGAIGVGVAKAGSKTPRELRVSGYRIHYLSAGKVWIDATGCRGESGLRAQFG